jgi:hypothetical protein
VRILAPDTAATAASRYPGPLQAQQVLLLKTAQRQRSHFHIV